LRQNGRDDNESQFDPSEFCQFMLVNFLVGAAKLAVELHGCVLVASVA